MAMSNYQSLHGTYPPAFIADASGQPIHSWRVLLLPLLDEQELYDAYRFDEPWNGPHNRDLAKRMPDVYRCAWNFDRLSTNTSYVVVVGQETMFPGGKARAAPPADGFGTTLLAVELADSGISWLEPRDIEFDAIDFDLTTHPEGYLRFSHPQDGHNSVRGALADGSRFWREFDSGETLRAWLTADGGESIADEQ